MWQHSSYFNASMCNTGRSGSSTPAITQPVHSTRAGTIIISFMYVLDIAINYRFKPISQILNPDGNYWLHIFLFQFQSINGCMYVKIQLCELYATGYQYNLLSNISAILNKISVSPALHSAPVEY